MEIERKRNVATTIVAIFHDDSRSILRPPSSAPLPPPKRFIFRPGTKDYLLTVAQSPRSALSRKCFSTGPRVQSVGAFRDCSDGALASSVRRFCCDSDGFIPASMYIPGDIHREWFIEYIYMCTYENSLKNLFNAKGKNFLAVRIIIV